MNTIVLGKKIDSAGTLRVKGEDFVILKKEYLDELSILLKSIVSGEKILKTGKTRSFNDCLKTLSKKKK